MTYNTFFVVSVTTQNLCVRSQNRDLSLLPYFASHSMSSTLIFVRGLLDFCILYLLGCRDLPLVPPGCPPRLQLYLSFILLLIVFILVRTNWWSSFRLPSCPVYVAYPSVIVWTPNYKLTGSSLTGDLDVESRTADQYAGRNIGVCSFQSYCLHTTFRKCN